MADEPISNDVTETVTTDTGVDKESIGSLNADFADFWKEEDGKTDGAPSAPGDGAAQETKEPKRETRRERSETPEPEPETREPKTETTIPETDDDIDQLDLPSDLAEKQPAIKQQFSDIKKLWHADRARARAESLKATQLQRELLEARANSWTPEAKADYEHAAAIRRKFDFASDPEFVQKFHAPITNSFHGVLNEAVDALPDRNQAMAWAKYIADNYSPDSLDKNWWNHSVIDKIPDETDRATVRQSVANLLRMQKERDTEINRRTNDKSSFDNWINEKTEHTAKRVHEEIMTEIGIQEKRIQEILPRDVEKAKTKEEREAIEKHNERFVKLNSEFQETMKDLSTNGPKAWVRASVEATRAKLQDGQIKEMETELKATKKERDQLRTELDKISGARRRISHTSGTPPAPSGKDAKKNGNGLSIKDLDVRKALNDFDWGDQ
jgi:hypothetical protein